MHKDGLMARGTVNLVLRDGQGKVKQHKTVRNKITNQGLAHIVGRMIDSGEDRVAYTGFPDMMRYMGLGTGDTGTIVDGTGTFTSAILPDADDVILERECTVGTVANAAHTSGSDLNAYAITYQTGRVDMSRSGNLPYLVGGVGHAENKIYQAIESANAPGVLQEDTGVSPEGTYDPLTGSAIDVRKTGDRLVYRAFFGENHPSLRGFVNGSQAATAAGANGPVSLPISEAGIFNAPAMIAADGKVGGGSQLGLNKNQSMLCRTRFKQVNKAPQDSLQVTWSIKIADQT
jgi:hypothetical protein